MAGKQAQRSKSVTNSSLNPELVLFTHRSPFQFRLILHAIKQQPLSFKYPGILFHINEPLHLSPLPTSPVPIPKQRFKGPSVQRTNYQSDSRSQPLFPFNMLHSLSFVGIAQGVIPVVLTVTSIGAWGPKFAMREDASL